MQLQAGSRNETLRQRGLEAKEMSKQEFDTASAKRVLRDASLRATAARVAVLKLLAADLTPLTHAEVVESLDEFGFDQSTLFRCLNELADAGLVTRLDPVSYTHLTLPTTPYV